MTVTNLVPMVHADKEAEKAEVEVRRQEGGGRVALLVGGAHPGTFPEIRTSTRPETKARFKKYERLFR